MTEAAGPQMRTIIVNCDPEWMDWPQQVRTRAADLYALEHGVEFWALGEASLADQAAARIWGGWPRYLGGNFEVLAAELRDAITDLTRDEASRLAIILIFGDPETAGDSRFKWNAALQQLGLALIEGIQLPANRLLRLLVFRLGGGRATPGITSRPGDALKRNADGRADADGVAFLTPVGRDSASAIGEASADVFLGLRLLLDLLASEEPKGWDIVRPGPGATPFALWLQSPALTHYVRDPAAPVRAQIASVVKRLGDTDAVGGVLQELDGTVARDVKALIEAVQPIKVASEQTAAAGVQTLPKRPDLQTILDWKSQAERAIRHAADSAGQRVEKGLEDENASIARSIADTRARVAKLNIFGTGVTMQARDALRRLESKVEETWKAQVDEAHNARDRIARDQIGRRTVGLDHKLWDMGRELRAEALRQVPGWQMALAWGGLVLGLLVAIWPALRDAAWTAAMSTLLELDVLSTVYFGIVALTALVTFLTHTSRVDHLATKASGALAGAQTFAAEVDQVVRDALDYPVKAAAAGQLRPVTERLRQLGSQLDTYVKGTTAFRSQAEAFAIVRPVVSLSDPDLRKLEAAVSETTGDSRLETAMATMLRQAGQGLPAAEVAIDFAEARADIRLKTRSVLAEGTRVVLQQIRLPGGG
jgi:hypothetical protein